MKYGLLFLFGFDLYPLIELAWRGETHLSMGIVGGICLVLIGKICGELMREMHYLPRCLAGAFIITVVELIAGFVINRFLGMHVWSYEQYPFNFYGQICWLYSSFWLLLTFPCIWCANITEKIVALFRSGFIKQG